MGLFTQILEFRYKQACKMIETGVFLKIKEHEAISTSIFFNLVAICLKLNDEIIYLTASLHLNDKKCREYMQDGEQKVEATDSTRFHNTLWNKIGSDRTSQYIDGLIHSVFAKNPTVSKFCDPDT